MPGFPETESLHECGKQRHHREHQEGLACRSPARGWLNRGVSVEKWGQTLRDPHKFTPSSALDDAKNGVRPQQKMGSSKNGVRPLFFSIFSSTGGQP